jgi:hypothetical protein
LDFNRGYKINGSTPDLLAVLGRLFKIGSHTMADDENSSSAKKPTDDDDYDDSIPPRIPRSVTEYSYFQEVTREWLEREAPPDAAVVEIDALDPLRASRLFGRYAKLTLKAAERVRKALELAEHEADRLRDLADDHPALWAYHKVYAEHLIAWIRAGAPKPRAAKLSPEQRALRAAAIARQRGRHGF